MDGTRTYFVECGPATDRYKTAEELLDKGLAHLLSDWAKKTSKARTLRAAARQKDSARPLTTLEGEEETRGEGERGEGRGEKGERGKGREKGEGRAANLATTEWMTMAWSMMTEEAFVRQIVEYQAV